MDGRWPVGAGACVRNRPRYINIFSEVKVGSKRWLAGALKKATFTAEDAPGSWSIRSMGQHANSLAAHRRNVKEQLAAQKKDATTESRTIPSVIKEWDRGPDTQANRELELGRSGWAASISEPYVPLGTPELQFKHPHTLLRGADESEEMRLRREQQEWEQRNRATLEEGLCVPLRRPKPKTHASHDLMQLAKQ
ncbi:hypothetical protein CYMTET_22582, partial [Cymbomonas tetramitiformis]